MLISLQVFKKAWANILSKIGDGGGLRMKMYWLDILMLFFGGPGGLLS